MANTAPLLDYKLILQAAKTSSPVALAHLEQIVKPSSVKLLTALLSKTKAVPSDLGTSRGHLYAVLLSQFACGQLDEGDLAFTAHLRPVNEFRS